jgi:hypothetical protein
VANGNPIAFHATRNRQIAARIAIIAHATLETPAVESSANHYSWPNVIILAVDTETISLGRLNANIVALLPQCTALDFAVKSGGGGFH